MKNILMVCTANVCRSPMAHIVAVQTIERRGLSRVIRVDSAGTHASKGAPQPDTRARAALQKRGYAVGKAKSRRIEAQDFERFDLVLAMDRSNLKSLQALCPLEHQPKIRLFLESTALTGTDEVPDPYYGNAEGFERVLDLCEAGVNDWLAKLA
jgi:protein-tyrosine phosphatase